MNETLTIQAQASLFDPVALLNSFGNYTLLGLMLLILVESGLLFPFLPGDSLLFTAGMIAANKSAEIAPFASLPTLLITLILAAFVGSELGYFIGYKFGDQLFKPEAKILKTEYLEQAHAFFAKHGPLTLILARYVPIVRTFIPISAGIAKMNTYVYATYNFISAVAWISLVTVAGYFLGNIAFIREHIESIFLIIIFLSILPIIIGFLTKYFKNRKF